MTIYTAEFVFNKHKEGVKYGETIFWGTDCVGKLCRHLQEGIVRIFSPNGSLSMTVNVTARKEKMLTELDKGGLRMRAFKPYPACPLTTK